MHDGEKARRLVDDIEAAVENARTGGGDTGKREVCNLYVCTNVVLHENEAAEYI